MANSYDVLLAIMEIARADMAPGVTFTNASDAVNMTSHGLVAGDGPFQFVNSGGSLPAELSQSTDYWVAGAVAPNTFQVAASRGGAAIDFTDDGSGTTILAGYGLAGAYGLTGKDVPIVRWEDLAAMEDPDRELPIATALVVVATPYRGLPPMLEATVQFDSWVPLGSEGLESQMIDRIEAIMTSGNFAGEGVDVAPTSGVRRTLTGEDFGRRRESMDMTLLLKV